MNRSLGRAALLDWRVGAVVLSALAAAIYWPAMNRVFAADQLWYFAEVGGHDSLALGLRHVDYAVSRVYWKGDDLLFRPILFIWLAIAYRVFAYHHVWWNVANLAIHVGVSIALLHFGRLRGAGMTAAAAALCGFAAFHAAGTATTARDVGRVNREPSRFFERISAFVDAHRSERDFSFAIEPHLESLTRPSAWSWAIRAILEGPSCTGASPRFSSRPTTPSAIRSTS
jgi:hypothetical protein